MSVIVHLCYHNFHLDITITWHDPKRNTIWFHTFLCMKPHCSVYKVVRNCADYIVPRNGLPGNLLISDPGICFHKFETNDEKNR